MEGRRRLSSAMARGSPLIVSVGSCCSCYSLRTGTRIIAALYCVGAVGELLRSALCVIRLFSDAGVAHRQDWLWFYLVAAILSGGLLATSVLLALGTYKERSLLLLPWLLASLGFLVWTLLSATYIACVSFDASVPGYGAPGVLLMLMLFILCVPELYCMVVVYSFYRDLNDREHGRLRDEFSGVSVEMLPTRSYTNSNTLPTSEFSTYNDKMMPLNPSPRSDKILSSEFPPPEKETDQLISLDSPSSDNITDNSLPVDTPPADNQIDKLSPISTAPPDNQSEVSRL